MFRVAGGFGHKHEGGASSIVLHGPLPPGQTFFAEKPKNLKHQVEPGGDDSYSYEDDVIDVKSKEEDGDRLVGGKSADTRLNQEFEKKTENTFQEISFRGRMEPAGFPRPDVLQW